MRQIIYFLLFISIAVHGQFQKIDNWSVYQSGSQCYLIENNDMFKINKNFIKLKFAKNVSNEIIENFESEHQLRFEHFSTSGFSIYRIPKDVEFIEYCNSISSYPSTKIIELVTYPNLMFEPNDEDIDEQQWYLEKINAFDAWDITTGNEDIIVAVIDWGLRWDLEDVGDEDMIHENIFKNFEDPWDEWDDPEPYDNDDDDGNGYINDFKGWDFWEELPNGGSVSTDNDVRIDPMLYEHGTAVSTIICAKTNNEIDIAGIAGGDYSKNKLGIRLLPVKVGDVVDLEPDDIYPLGDEFVDDAIIYAVDMGAKVINLSLTTFNSQDVRDALDYAELNGVVVICSSGNTNQNDVKFPANYSSTIAVGACNQNDERWVHDSNIGSCYGSGLDLTAPGEDISSLGDDGDIFTGSGTSPSASIVSATISLMLSINSELSISDIKDILYSTAYEPDGIPFPNGWNEELGHGIVNTFAASYEVLYNPIYTPDPVEITENKTWVTQRDYYSDLIIHPGVTLTIKDVLNMRVGTKIIIKPQGKLVVDGGKITSKLYCDDPELLWTGIEVWGTDDSQYPVGGIVNQGILELKNGAIIENAERAISVYQPDANADPIANTTGGIVKASENTSFINCQRVARFYDYQYEIFPGVIANNLSYFHDCSFEIDQNYLGNPIDRLNDLYKVKGVDFKGCTFINDFDQLPTGTAIYAHDAGFKVMHTNQTQPPFDINRSSFENFEKAVCASHSQTTSYTATINNTDFISNGIGVQLTGTNNATIINSNFYLGYLNMVGCSSTTSFGIDLLNCTGYAVEENFFAYITGPQSDNFIGIRIKDSNGDHDEIYRNEFENLTKANFSEMKNFGINVDNGLCYFCNTNISNEYDFYVADDPFGIQTNQGATTKATGNTFSPTNALGHFLNFGGHKVFYHYANLPDQEPNYSLIYNVKKVSAMENLCPSHYGGGSGGSKDDDNPVTLDDLQYNERVAAFNQATTDFNAVKVLFDSYEDGGNTELLQSDIETAFPDDMWELRSQLLNTSPHLSGEVLKTTADRTDVFPESVIFEILAANPDELGKEELLSYLENKEDPLPQYMVDILRQMDGEITYKTILQQEMAKHKRIKFLAAYDLIRSNLNQEEVDSDDLIYWLGNLNTLNADLQISNIFIQYGDYQSAESLLNLLPDLYDLEGSTLDDFNDYKTLKLMQMQLNNENRSIFDLSDPEKAVLYDLADGTNKASYEAQSILSYAYNEEYCHCPNYDGGENKSGMADLSNNFIDQIISLQIKPNPASEWVAFDYEKFIDFNTTISISDPLGRQIHSFSIVDMKGQKLWDVRNLEPGLYLVNINAGNYTKSEQLIIK